MSTQHCAWRADNIYSISGEPEDIPLPIHILSYQTRNTSAAAPQVTNSACVFASTSSPVTKLPVLAAGSYCTLHSPCSSN
ncbi:hypothetical protein E2C01_100756 [Portunus trituberculatus]|uniref:Uncharacterized protein n=1 Tax=Portunus trituberculatus TaxID=210409 RepID=A0A5B7KDU5_PORTR|nr:hypothetical protein [Portunus trituberculatus]